MRTFGALSLIFVALTFAILCPPVASAQVPKRLQRCFPYPTFAEEVETMREEVALKTASSEPKSKEAIIDTVEFDGPISLPKPIRDQLVADMKGREFYGIGPVVDGWIREAWQDQGYFEESATAQFRIVGGDPSSEHVALSIHLDEGLQYFLGDLVFRSSDPDEPLRFAQEELRKQVSVENGDIFDAGKIRDSLEALRHLYGSQGYIDITAEPIFEIDDAHHRISMTLVLDQGKQFHIGRVDVLSLDPKVENALRSKMRSGDLFNPDVLKQFLEENKSALPYDVSLEDVNLKRNTKTGIVDMTFDFFTCPQVQD